MIRANCGITIIEIIVIIVLISIIPIVTFPRSITTDQNNLGGQVDK
ncbi:hypothetical protein N9219_01625 [bacterium]|nr:hypothetical protein [bacterium]